MAKKKQEDPPKGAPAWMNTFSDESFALLLRTIVFHVDSGY